MPESHTDDERALAARGVLAEKYGRPLTDEEWSVAQARLLSYVRLLRDWDRREWAGDTVPPA
jgi:hypothetical protein